jgi:hypothetical protein
MTALLFASAGGHVDMVRWLVREAGSDPRRERAKVRLCGKPHDQIIVPLL